MVDRVCSYQQQEWERLLEDALPPRDAEELTLHIEQCATCRSKFESLCATPEAWESSSSMLRELGSQSGLLEQVVRKEGHAARDSMSDLTAVVRSWLTPSTEPDALGTLDDYSVRELIGFGGMGTVMRAWDRKLCRVVAIKVLHPHLASNGAARNRFAREAQAVACVSHPHVVPIHDVAADHQPPYIVMGYVGGGSLQEKIDRDGPMGLEESLRIAMQVAEGLDAAHAQGLVHRDIKPANLMLEARWQRVLITDFGLARALDDVSLTASGMLAGTPQYMSPEQAMGHAIDGRSDLFSLGSVLYAMLTGHSPFRADTAVAVLRRVSDGMVRPVHTIEPRLPNWVHPLLMRLLAKDPSQRLATAGEAAELLRQCWQHVTNPSVFPLPKELRRTASLGKHRLSLYGGSMAFIAIGFLLGWNSQWTWSTNPKTQSPSSAKSNADAIGPLATATRSSSKAPNPNRTKSQSVLPSVARSLSTVPEQEFELGWNDPITEQIDQLQCEIDQLEGELGILSPSPSPLYPRSKVYPNSTVEELPK